VSSYGAQQLECLIKSRETHLSGFHLNPADQVTAAQVIKVIVALKNDIFYNEQLIWLQILALSVLLQRNMPELKSTQQRTRAMRAIFCYLHNISIRLISCALRPSRPISILQLITLALISNGIQALRSEITSTTIVKALSGSV